MNEFRTITDTASVVLRVDGKLLRLDNSGADGDNYIRVIDAKDNAEEVNQIKNEKVTTFTGKEVNHYYSNASFTGNEIAVMRYDDAQTTEGTIPSGTYTAYQNAGEDGMGIDSGWLLLVRE